MFWDKIIIILFISIKMLQTTINKATAGLLFKTYKISIICTSSHSSYSVIL